jgi:hypothetical protein
MKNIPTRPIYRTYALANVKRYQSCHLGDQGGGGGLHPACSTAALGQSDCYQDNNKSFYSDHQEKKNQVAKGNTNKRRGGIRVYIQYL